MDAINILELSMSEINFRMMHMKEVHRDTLLLLLLGYSNDEIAMKQKNTARGIALRIASARDRAGLDSTAQLIAMFAIWEYSRKSDKT